MPFMIDLFSGMGGASRVMKERGWRVVTVDNEPSFSPDVIADITSWQWSGRTPDLLWASPPCTEFARESMPWCRTGVPPCLDLANATMRLIRKIGPRFWVVENVRGSVKHLTPIFGPPRDRFGPFYLYGDFPKLWLPKYQGIPKEHYSSSKSHIRAEIPYDLSYSVAVEVELFRHTRRKFRNSP